MKWIFCQKMCTCMYYFYKSCFPMVKWFTGRLLLNDSYFLLLIKRSETKILTWQLIYLLVYSQNESKDFSDTSVTDVSSFVLYRFILHDIGFKLRYTILPKSFLIKYIYNHFSIKQKYKLKTLSDSDLLYIYR